MTTAKQKRKVERVLHEYKTGTLKSRSGRKVKSRQQSNQPSKQQSKVTVVLAFRIHVPEVCGNDRIR